MICPPPTKRGEEAKASKTGSFDNTVVGNDIVSRTAGRSFIYDVFRRALTRTPLDSLVFDFSLPLYEKAIRWASEAAKLGDLELTPHTARHGGPSDDAANARRTLKEISGRGRWESMRSVNRYKRAGTLRRQESKLSAEHHAIAEQDTSSLARKIIARINYIDSHQGHTWLWVWARFLGWKCILDCGSRS